MKQFAKFWTALGGLAAVLISGGVVPDPYVNYVQVGLAAVAAFLVYYVPNEAR
jgi:hypothetical protein